MRLWQRITGRLDRWTTWGGSALADEAEAYLEGRLLERLQESGAGGRPPAWLWLNAVAHGDRATLEQIVGTRRDQTAPVTGWRSARAAAARELLDLTMGDAEGIRRAQLAALIPLEASLAAVHDLTPSRMHEIAVQEMRFSLT